MTAEIINEILNKIYSRPTWKKNIWIDLGDWKVDPEYAKYVCDTVCENLRDNPDTQHYWCKLKNDYHIEADGLGWPDGYHLYITRHDGYFKNWWEQWKE